MKRIHLSPYDRPDCHCDIDRSDAFTHYKMDQGPVLNRLGRLLLLLHDLGLKSPAPIFAGKAGAYRYGHTKKGIKRL